MGNIVSYLKWRGDLDFRERGFSDADNLVLSALAYIRFNGIVPETGEEMTVKAAADAYFDERDRKLIPENSNEQVLLRMAYSRRFADARLSVFVNMKREEQKS